MFRNVKMPIRIVCILTFISIMNTNAGCFEVRQICYVLLFLSFLEQLTSMLNGAAYEHSFITSGSDRADTHASVNH